MTTTMWRIVENLDVPAFGLISIHPQENPEVGKNPVRYFIRSRRFQDQFPDVCERIVFRELRQFCFRRRGPLGSGDVILNSLDGEKHVFRLDAFNNSHDTLTLGVYQGQKNLAVAIP